MVTVGDCVVDSAGAIGLVIDVGNDVMFKTYAFDGMEFTYHSPAGLVTQMSDRFKKAWLREIRMLKRRDDHAQDAIDA